LSDATAVVILASVTSNDLTDEQVEALKRHIGRQLRYLGKLCKRLDAVGFSPVDWLYTDAHQAFDAIHTLSVKLHSLSVKSGVGRRD
jgi:hypothetical protein